jgi:molybdopterin-binding protein
MMEVSARNQLEGKVKNVVLGGVMAEVTVDIGDGKEIVAAVTRGSVERMGLTDGELRCDHGIPLPETTRPPLVSS